MKIKSLNDILSKAHFHCYHPSQLAFSRISWRVSFSGDHCGHGTYLLLVLG
jgi:hypothetical protein